MAMTTKKYDNNTTGCNNRSRNFRYCSVLGNGREECTLEFITIKVVAVPLKSTQIRADK